MSSSECSRSICLTATTWPVSRFVLLERDQAGRQRFGFRSERRYGQLSPARARFPSLFLGDMTGGRASELAPAREG